jgi:hypothetical protein
MINPTALCSCNEPRFSPRAMSNSNSQTLAQLRRFFDDGVFCCPSQRLPDSLHLNGEHTAEQL